MKTLITKSTLSLFTVALTLVAADVASAGLRGTVVVEKDLGPATVRVRLQTPDQVRWHRPPVVHTRPAPVVLHVSAYDRAVAHRLSVVTGIPERPLLAKRSRGISWHRIARVHDISRRELNVAQNPRLFQKWLARRSGPGHGHFGSCGDDHYGGGTYAHQGKGHGKGHGKKGGKGRGNGRR